MIDKVREYMAQCPYLDEFTAINIDYLVDKSEAYSITEQPGYNPVIFRDVTGCNKYCQFIFYFDAKLVWNSELENNLKNNNLFYNISNWLEENNNKEIYPEIEGISIDNMEAISNGYLFDTNSNEAIYRIVCKIKYWVLS